MMGGSDSKYISESELSNSESESSSLDECESPPEEVDDLIVTTDAALGNPISLPKAQDVLNSDRVQEIEKQLEKYEVISLLFLLLNDYVDETEGYLQERFLNGSSKTLLHDWAKAQVRRAEGNWQNKLIEALCVIKNYEVLKALGFQKFDVRNHYLPYLAITTLHINKIRKAKYLICEKLDSQKTTCFLEHVRKKFSEKKMLFHEYDPQFLELYFMKWEISRTFTLTDVKDILKTMEEEELYTMLDEITLRGDQKEKVPFETIPIRFDPVQGSSKCGHPSKSSGTRSNESLKSSNTSMDNPVQEYVDSNYTFMDYQLPHVGLAPSSAHSDMSLEDHKYPINPNKPGVVLIINQADFFTEINEEYKHLLPSDKREKLVSRKGTEKDKQELEKVFNKFGFKVIVEENLSHIDMIQIIKDVVKSIEEESSLFICILSHGDKGVVYGANSCKVKISKIQEIMHKANNKYLAGKPKVLILQSCQGQECQKLVESDEDCDEDNKSLTTDGPAPLLRDMITFYASLPGYAAIRSKITGSWFIQALCNQMIQAGNRHHFADICTRTAHEVSQQVWIKEKDKKAMTPQAETTLLKAFYLPPMRRTDSAK